MEINKIMAKSEVTMEISKLPSSKSLPPPTTMPSLSLSILTQTPLMSGVEILNQHAFGSKLSAAVASSTAQGTLPSVAGIFSTETVDPHCHISPERRLSAFTSIPQPEFGNGSATSKTATGSDVNLSMRQLTATVGKFDCDTIKGQGPAPFTLFPGPMFGNLHPEFSLASGISGVFPRRRRKETHPRRQRTTFTSDQTLKLELEYQRTEYITRPRRFELAEVLSLSETQIKIWFQNRRAKDKRIEKAQMDQHVRTLTFGGAPTGYPINNTWNGFSGNYYPRPSNPTVFTTTTSPSHHSPYLV